MTIGSMLWQAHGIDAEDFINQMTARLYCQDAYMWASEDSEYTVPFENVSYYSWVEL